MKKLKFVIYTFWIYCFGAVAGLNAAILYPNPEYDAGRLKIVFTAALAVLFASIAWFAARKDSE